MSASLMPFDFETNAVRILMREGEPWFVAADVCRVLEHRNPRQVISRLQDDEKGVLNVDTLGGEQEMNVVSESGLYALVFTSRKPAAQRFRKWVTAEVLPAIRRDGGCALATPDRAELDAKRAYLASLPEEHQEIARRRAEVMRDLEDAIAEGDAVTSVVKDAAATLSVSNTTIWNMRRAIYMIGRSDWEAALAPRWAGPRGMVSECHPDAMQMYLDLVAAGHRMMPAYRRVAAAAVKQGWQPIPSARTMAREANRTMPRAHATRRISREDAA